MEYFWHSRVQSNRIFYLSFFRMIVFFVVVVVSFVVRQIWLVVAPFILMLIWNYAAHNQIAEKNKKTDSKVISNVQSSIFEIRKNKNVRPIYFT